MKKSGRVLPDTPSGYTFCACCTPLPPAFFRARASMLRVLGTISASPSGAICFGTDEAPLRRAVWSRASTARRCNRRGTRAASLSRWLLSVAT